jgi:hypothetical protein
MTGNRADQRVESADLPVRIRPGRRAVIDDENRATRPVDAPRGINPANRVRDIVTEPTGPRLHHAR